MPAGFLSDRISADPLFVEGIYDYKVYEWMKVVPEEDVRVETTN